MALVLDTGPLLAAIDRADPDHARCLQMIEQAREALVVPAPVIVELDFWWRTKLTLDDYLAFLDDIVSGAYSVADLDDLDYTRARELQATYSGIGVSLVDASVLATVEKLGEHKLATLDHRHFSAMQPRHVGSLRLLP